MGLETTRNSQYAQPMMKVTDLKLNNQRALMASMNKAEFELKPAKRIELPTTVMDGSKESISVDKS